MAVETTTAPTLIQEQVAQLLVQPLEAASVVLASGPRIFDSSEPLRIPTLTGGVDPAWVGESELIPEADAQFGEIRLMPSDRKSIKVITRFSNEMARQSAVALDAVLRARLVNDVAAKLDDALLTGDGADATVTGIVNQPGVQTGVLDTGDLDSLHDAIGLAIAAEVQPNRWFLNGGDFVALRKIKDTQGNYIVESDVTQGATYRLLGIPATVTNKLPTGTAVLANMAEVAVVRDVAPSVTILDQRYAEYDQMGIRVVTRYDLGTLHPEGVLVLQAAA